MEDIAAVILVVAGEPVSSLEMIGQVIEKVGELVHLGKRQNVARQNEGIGSGKDGPFLPPGVIFGPLEVEVGTVLKGHEQQYTDC